MVPGGLQCFAPANVMPVSSPTTSHTAVRTCVRFENSVATYGAASPCNPRLSFKRSPRSRSLGPSADYNPSQLRSPSTQLHHPWSLKLNPIPPSGRYVRHPISPTVCQAKSSQTNKQVVETSTETNRDKGTASEANRECSDRPLRLILLRHAKSSWDDPSLEDHARPLNRRGRKAAPDVAAQLRLQGWLPELILSSDSVRTRETLKRMIDEWGELADVPTEYLRSFYEVAATEDGLTNTVQLLEEAVVEKAGAVRSVMLIGHNMGWEQAASQFAREYVQMKTACAVLLESERFEWKEAFQEKWRLVRVVKPESSKSLTSQL